MNIQATQSLAEGSASRLDGREAINSAGASTILPLDPATPRVLFWAFAVVLISAASLAFAVPFVRIPLAKIPAFIPSYESALAICDLVTAVLLFGRVSRRRSLGFLALACGYLFNAIIIVLHLLSFPGAFSETGLLGANDQTTAWLFVFWHSGFPLFVLGYALLPDKDSESQYLRKHTAMALTLGCVGVFVLMGASMLLATVGHGLLPTIIKAGNYSLMVSSGASPTILVLTTLALLALWRRPKWTVLDVWLMVVMSVWLLDVTLSAVVSSARYDLGWYVGRSYSLMAACCLLILLLYEMNRLYDRLNAALKTAGALELDLTYRAENDSLTGLPNRALFYDRLEMAMTRSRRSKKLMALLYIDIDKFKTTNDNLGHAAGDLLLRTFSQRLLLGVRASDTVARLGGDEFTVILEDLSLPKIAQAVVDKLMTALRLPYTMGEDDIRARASMGIAYFSGGRLKSDDLVKQADLALYEAKHRGRDGYWVHQPEAA